MEHYRLVKNGQNNAIYSLDSNQKNLKLVMTLPHPRQKVLAAMIDPANYHFWNDEVDIGNIKLRIYSENTVIAYQKHKAFDKNYRERDFLYLRHLFQRNNVIYMVDKSIEHSNFPPFDYITRGEIKLALWAFEAINYKSTKLIYMVHTSFKGSIGGSKVAESMIRYLENMVELSNYLSGPSRITTKVEDYFDLSWGVNNRG
jgi:hypothetical protein